VILHNNYILLWWHYYASLIADFNLYASISITNFNKFSILYKRHWIKKNNDLTTVDLTSSYLECVFNSISRLYVPTFSILFWNFLIKYDALFTEICCKQVILIVPLSFSIWIIFWIENCHNNEFWTTFSNWYSKNVDVSPNFLLCSKSIAFIFYLILPQLRNSYLIPEELRLLNY